MKIFLTFFILGVMTSCTHYSTAPINKDRVIVSKTTTILSFWGGTIYACRKDNKGVIIDCKENEIPMKESVQGKQ